MQGLDRSIRGLFLDGPIEERGGILGIQSLGGVIFTRIQAGSFLFILGFAQIAAEK